MSAISARFLLLAALLPAACTTPAKLDALVPEEKEALKGHSVVFVRRPLPVFELYKTSDSYLQMVAAPFGLAAIWGTFGALMANQSNRSDAFLAEYQLTDPSYGVAAELGRSLGVRYGVAFAGVTDAIADTDDDKKVIDSLKGRVEFALDIRTDRWGLITTAFTPKYRFVYKASMSLIDTDSGSVVASGACRYWKKNAEARGWDELTDANATLLKQEVRGAIQDCAQQFSATILKERDATP